MPPLRYLLFLVMLAGGCARSEQPTASVAEADSTNKREVPPASVAATESAPEPHIAVPTQSKGFSTGVAATGDDWRSALETLTPDERLYVQALNARHFGAFAFRNADERRKLETLGFPTLEDVLEASRLTVDELRAKADAGDVQARMLLADRLTTEAESLMGVDEKAYERAGGHAYMEVAQLMRSGSPFGPYLDGRLGWKLKSTPAPEIMAASLMVASDLGDWRAKTWLQQFQKQHPELNAASTVQTYAILRRSWHVP